MTWYFDPGFPMILSFLIELFVKFWITLQEKYVDWPQFITIY